MTTAGATPVATSILLSAEQLRQRGGEKWRRYPPEVIPAFVADMDFLVAEDVQLAICDVVRRQAYGYPEFGEPDTVEEAFALRMHRRFDWEVSAHDICVLTDVVQGIAACIVALSTPEDGVVVQTPAYPPFLSTVRSLGRRIVENRLTDTHSKFSLDIEGLENAIDDRTRILLLCHPHNPTGRVFTTHDLRALERIVVEHDLILVSDEIHAELVYHPARHIPAGATSAPLGERTVTLSSATKAWNIAGLRCAIAHFGSPSLLERFNMAVPRALLGQVDNVSKAAAKAALASGDAWMDAVRTLLTSNRAAVLSWVQNHPPLRCHPPEGTYLAWIDCSALCIADPLNFFLDHAGVALKGGLDFGAPGQHAVRLNFATSPQLLDRTLSRMSSALHRHRLVA